MASQASTTLSSTSLNAWFKAGDLEAVIRATRAHLASDPADGGSVGKFLNALAYHAYHHRIEDEAGLAALVELTAQAFERLAGWPSQGSAADDKCQSAGCNVILKRLLIDLNFPAVATVGTAFRGYALARGRPEVGEFLQQLLRFNALAADWAEQSPALRRDLAGLLPGHRLGSGDFALRTFFVQLLGLELRVQWIKRENGELEPYRDATEAARAWVRAHVDRQASVACWESLLGQGLKLGLWLGSSRRSGEAQQQLLTALALYTSELKPLPHYVPSQRVVSLYNHLLDGYASAGDRAAIAEQAPMLTQVLAQIQSSRHPSLGSFGLHVCLSMCHFHQFRRAYDTLVEATAREIEHNERLGAQSQSEKPDPDDPNQNIKDIGDVNPYLLTLTLEKEAELFRTLKIILASLLTASNASDTALTGTGLSPNAVLRMIGCLAEFFQLFGYSSEYETTLGILYHTSQSLGHREHEMVAIKALVRAQDHFLGPVVRERIQTLLQSPIGAAHLNLSLALAWDCLHQSRWEQAFQLCASVVDQAAGDCPGKLIAAEAFLLLSLCSSDQRITCAPPSLVHHGAQEFAFEAYRAVMVTCASLMKHAALHDSLYIDVLRGHRLKMEIVVLRAELYKWTGLPKDLRLYGKLALQHVQSLALPSRLVETLLEFVNIDVLCDDVDQAELKLQSVEKIIHSSLAAPNLLGIRSKVPRSKAKDKLGASPSLKRPLMTPPAWLEDENACSCLHCSQPLLLPHLAQYFNLKGVIHHMREDVEAAGSFFNGTRDLIKALETKLECQKSLNVHTQTRLSFITALQWQVECYARDEYLSRCQEVLELQADQFRKIPPTRQLSATHHKYRWLEQSLMCRIPSKADLSGLGLALTNMNIASPLPTLIAPKCGEGDVTPMIERPRRRNPPRRPNKKLLVP
eukprot:maker-scaffold180_size281610-snap-gene-1.30 protein:Tk11876 transcript:maker-scaffold180_size281610-snap-gene-1.30-mRNA-1 annotation:"PREDICTED: uncharacterized protein LOC100680231"